MIQLHGRLEAAAKTANEQQVLLQTMSAPGHATALTCISYTCR